MIINGTTIKVIHKISQKNDRKIGPSIYHRKSFQLTKRLINKLLILKESY
ncbi:MAG: hypothetical protein CM15mP112_07870 [Flavobacteriales bacterium]|nr:MAG: hypothetical protein CM15mP112_07870 [Flavobacteriales bacterium]